MTEDELFRYLFQRNQQSRFVVSNGFLSRRAFHLGSDLSIFYMIGSMGLSLSIGLGFALCRPQESIVVVEGDGNLLMALGGLAMVGHGSPANLLHVLMDNQVYASTGGQPTFSSSIDFCASALAAGYSGAQEVRTLAEFGIALDTFATTRGPFFVRAFTAIDMQAPQRVALSPEEITNRFRLRSD
jgi:thiamine pyrophosphate-dependent acetolactate synthase large subunit-like protein